MHPLAPHRYLRLLRHRARREAALRSWVRSSEVGVVVLATLTGAGVGVLAWGMGAAAHGLQRLLYGLGPEARLSTTTFLPSWRLLLVPVLGGLALALLNWAIARWRAKPPVDPIEANALHGGRMSLSDAVVVGAQTVVSNGFGASVGLEAGYAQAGGGLASRLGAAFSLRRGDLRILVGAGTAGAIGAAFDAPLTGAFYAFELVIGTYSIGALFPVVASAVTAVLVARSLAAHSVQVEALVPSVIDTSAYPLALAVGALCGLSAILLMRGVGLAEAGLARLIPSPMLRLAVGGLAVGTLAQVSPVALSAGHGALHLTLVTEAPAWPVLALLLVKALASILSIGSGFRGGLFFASLLIGGLGGKLFAALLALLDPPGPDPLLMVLVGMSAFGAAVIGAPLAMTFLALETTGSLAVTGLVLASVAVSGLIVRRLFGYSFATWRFHLRGESIRSAHDIGWINDLTAAQLMRRDVAQVPQDIDLASFRRAFPLGATARVVAVDAAGCYAGLVSVPEVHAAPPEVTCLAPLLHHRGTVLLPGMNARDAMAAFGLAEADALAVVEPASHRPVGLLTEAHLLRRYGEEVQKRRREESGLWSGTG
ncbi:chloride channel protein [Siccirubricoccus deserti]|uniref:Chloride channel protein n=1 Tax=Siccirubricoccus deserti TaxID=2013562 RepID=A0A9X0QWN8_9PROT|nr:chloride channel protein [Siccirubricoccus deserti]MBC4014253.1 chloride channel protein [Siccirubricoccus deserti]GGC27832.1 chloride channel protein [Siccirubricoccus deserti]